MPTKTSKPWAKPHTNARKCKGCGSQRPGMQPLRLNNERGYWHIECFEKARSKPKTRPIEPKDVARAVMGDAGSKKILVTKMPPTRPTMCAGCPFGPNMDAFVRIQCEVLKDALREKPNAVWMCHETAGGGTEPTAKSIICKGFAEWSSHERIRRPG